MLKVAPRILHGLLLLVGVSIIAFTLLSLAPGNFFDELKLNPQVSPATVAALKIQYGMDRPFPVRYLRWLASVTRGDFGYSLSYHSAVAPLLMVSVFVPTPRAPVFNVNVPLTVTAPPRVAPLALLILSGP